jgi:hypothetical protein
MFSPYLNAKAETSVRLWTPSVGFVLALIIHGPVLFYHPVSVADRFNIYIWNAFVSGVAFPQTKKTKTDV